LIEGLEHLRPLPAAERRHVLHRHSLPLRRERTAERVKTEASLVRDPGRFLDIPEPMGGAGDGYVALALGCGDLPRGELESVLAHFRVSRHPGLIVEKRVPDVQQVASCDVAERPSHGEVLHIS